MEKENKKPTSENQKPKDKALDDSALDEVSGGAKGVTRNTGTTGGHHSRLFSMLKKTGDGSIFCRHFLYDRYMCVLIMAVRMIVKMFALK